MQVSFSGKAALRGIPGLPSTCRAQHVPSGQVLLTPLSFSHRRLPAVVLRWAVYVPMCIVVHKGTVPTRLPAAPGAVISAC